MPELLKNIYSPDFAKKLAKEIKSNYSKFDSKKFEKSVFNEAWDNMELKDRMFHIASSLDKHLTNNYIQNLSILRKSAPKFTGFEAMLFPAYVELFGLEDYEESISALEHFTQYSSSEFAVRPFIIKSPVKMMKQMETWAKSNNHHVRRLSSEGCRPRLPWAMALPEFKKNPKAVLKILELLRHDESEYVRRSVANNLNDISKDNPHLVRKTAKTWLGHNKNTDWIVKHACRSLLKQGDQEILQLFGFSKPAHIDLKKLDTQKIVTLGNKLAFSFELETTKKSLGKLRLEYAIDFVKANNKRSRKVFKISESTNDEQLKSIEKYHSFKEISTRKYYPGEHQLSIIVNGQEMANKIFRLKM